MGHISNILIVVLVSIINQVKCQLACNPLLCVCASNQCTTCISSAFFINSSITVNSCQLCHYKCSTCTSALFCTTCTSGYVRSQDSNTSSMDSTFCLECPVFCSVCADPNYCTKCIDGYVSVLGVCKPCALPNVLSCQSQTTVSSCKSGFWKNGDSCSPCRQFCQSCTSSTNCIICADGYRVQVSAGTYCAPCPLGCKICTSQTVCSSCLRNFRLVSSTCINIQNQCKTIANCQQCQYSTSSVVQCKVCNYPYYYSSTLRQCVLGASLLCANGANGLTRYECLNSCTSITDKIDTLGNQFICSPKLWIPSSDIKQHYFEALNSWNIFQENNYPYLSCGSALIYSKLFTSTMTNVVVLQNVFKPYYKLIINVKAIPIYKQISPNQQITLTVRMKDNSTISQQYSQIINTSDHSFCRHTYFMVQSKNIKDQNVRIQFEAKLVSNSASNLSASAFSQGLMGYSQIMIQLYRCSSDCRICSNSKYCIECYGNLFSYENHCVSQCYGFFQFYAPVGNYSNYTYKSCLQKCPQKFYNDINPLKTGVYMCKLCSPPCLTCKSQNQCLSCITPYLYYDLGFACILQCPDTHYKNQLTNLCVPCNSPCRTCQTQTTCTSCSIGYYLPPNSSCVGLCPLQYFANITSRTCQLCFQRCSSCLNSPTNCLSCKQNFFLLNNACIQSCPNLTHFPVSNRCQICKPPCLQCFQQKKCVNCITGYLLDNWCYSTCPNGYYGNFTSNKCQNCIDINCLRCSSSSTCQACSNNTYLYNSICYVSCPTKTFPNNDVFVANVGYMCATCQQPCYQCKNFTYCISCQIGYLSKVSLGKCVSVCERGYFALETTNSSMSNTVARTCQLCFIDCSDCKNFQNCLGCSNSNHVLTPDQKCRSSCPMGYYNHSKVCQTCNYPCLTCVNSSQTCLSCYQPYILSQTSCLSQCSMTQYQKLQQCFPCKSPCKTCINENQCTSCQISLNQTYLWNMSCISICPLGTYSDTITLRCRSCNYPCATCMDSKKCITCSTGYLNRIKNTCQMCSQITFANEQTKQCQFCNSTIPNCRICSSSTVCRYCSLPYYLYLGKCIDQVQCSRFPNFYPNSQQMTCSPCIPPCGKCISQNQCLSCATGYFLNKKCLLQCPTGYFASFLSNSCQSCNMTLCLTCNLAPSSCTSCNTTSNKSVLMPSLSTCISSSQCPSQFYIDQSFGYSRCIKCQSPCLTCSSSRICTSCLSGILYNGQCKSSCPISFYQVQTSNNSQSAQCLACSTNCLKCRNSPGYCVACSQDKFLQQATCVDQCRQGFYLDTSSLQCKKCNSPCKTCTSASLCLTCLQTDINGANLTSIIVYYGQCLQVCPDGSYQANNSCLKCPQQCQICIYKQTKQTHEILCKKCSQGLFMNTSQQGLCSSFCETWQYPDIYTRNCYSCQFPCVTCKSATACNSCQQGYLIYVNDCVKGSICPAGTFKFFNQTTNQFQCIDKCVLPLYGNNFTRECVLQCPFNYVKFDPGALCMKQCPKQYYLSNNLLCQKCSQNSMQNSGSTNKICDNLLNMEIRAKSIFNSLFVRINFNQQVSLEIFKQYENKSSNLISIQYRVLSQIYQKKRLLQTSSVLSYSINPITSSNTIWLKIETMQSFSPVQINVGLSSHYLFTGKVLQNVNATYLLDGFDKYSDQQISRGQNFQVYAKIVSLLMCILFIINLGFNTGYLMYPMIDFYQLLFLLLFLNVDYPPIMNYFLYGFRYSHYLFLPQIFNTGKMTTISANAPQKFGIIVPDANFLHNTGHEFLIMFIVIGIFSVLKFIDFIVKMFENNEVRSNKVKNQQQIEQSRKQSRFSTQKQSKKQQQQIDSNKQSSQSETRNYKNQDKQITTVVKIRNGIIIVLNRIRWNYFNDFLYTMYFYLMLFAFCQLYEIGSGQSIDYASTVFSIIFILLGVFWPFGLLIMLLYKNSVDQIFKKQDDRNNQEECDLQRQKDDKYQSQYQCFVATIKPNSNNFNGLLMVPVEYIKKLILAILFAFCSSYQNFIIGIIIMLQVVAIITNIIYRPFKNKIYFFAHLIFHTLFCIASIFLAVLMVSGIPVNKQSKNLLSIFGIIIYLLLSILLCVYNCAIIGLQVLKFFTNKDYIQKYEQKTSLSQNQNRKSQGQLQKKDGQSCEQSSKYENSNLRLNLTMTKNRKNSDQYLISKLRNKNDESSAQNGCKDSPSDIRSEQSNGLDIYLKQDIKKVKAPKILIKCVKGTKFKESQEEQSDSSSKSNQQQNKRISQSEQDSDYKKIIYQKVGMIQNKFSQKPIDFKQPEVFSQENNNLNNKIEKLNRKQAQLQLQQQKNQNIKQENIFQKGPQKLQQLEIKDINEVQISDYDYDQTNNKSIPRQKSERGQQRRKSERIKQCSNSRKLQYNGQYADFDKPSQEHQSQS